MIKYYLILILSISDALCTRNGIIAGFITESNPLLKDIFESSPTIASIYIIIASICMIYVLYYGERIIWWLKYGVYMIVGAKVLVLFAHVYWITLVMIYF